jgi:hypothetical protein
VATTRAGVHVVSPGRGTITTIDSSRGLPEYNRSFDLNGIGRWDSRAIVLHPIETGRCVANGTAGGERESRQWFATLTAADGMGKVFHSATKLAHPHADDDPQGIFKTAWYAWDASEQRLFVGRRSTSDPRRALVIDIPRLAVHVEPAATTSAHWDKAVVTRNKLFLLNSNRVERYRLETGGLIGGQIYEVWHHSNVPFAAIHASAANTIHFPGKYWFRLDCDTERLEYLGELPQRHQYECYGYSTHYGLIAWNRFEGLYRILIDDPASNVPFTSQRLAEEYPFVPIDKRLAHHNAVQAARATGGNVGMWLERRGTHIRVAAHVADNGSQPKWVVVASLPRRLEGSSDAEKIATGLHNLREVQFYDLPEAGLAREREREPLKWMLPVKSKPEMTK